MITRINIILIIIILLAALLRLVNLSTIPIGFNDDEAAFGYNAYSILKSGQDEWGKFLPFPVFESFGDWKLVGYLYMVVASQSIFGTGELATRLPSALMGVLAVFATYLLTKELFRGMYEKYNKHDKYEREIDAQISSKSHLRGVSLSSPGPHLEGEKPSPRLPQLEIGNWKLDIPTVAALLLAISPWHIVASRNAFESDILVFTITLATYFFLKGLQNSKFFTLSIFIFSLSFYIYRSAWLFVPLFFLSLVWWHRGQFKQANIHLAKNAVLALILLAPLIPTVLTFKGQSRFLQESFVAGVQNSGLVDDVNHRRGECQKFLPPAACAAIYNKYVFYFSTYIGNYIGNLSPEIYYLRGNPGGYQSFSIRSLFYTFELPLLVLGLIFMAKTKPAAAKILIPWLLIVPLGASVTGIGNPGRLNILMPVPQIIAAYGLVSLVAQVRAPIFKKTTVALVSLIIVASLTRLVADMFFFYPQVSGRYQRYGYKELFGYLASQKDNYQQIAVSRATDDAKQYIHYLFYQRIDPQIFHDPQKTASYRGTDSWRVVERIENVYFYGQTPKVTDLPANSLLAVAHGEVSFSPSPVFVVKYLNGDSAFEVYDVKQ